MAHINQKVSTLIFVVFFVFSFWLQSPSYALLLGLIYALTCSSEIADRIKNHKQFFLQIAIVGLGFGMNFNNVIEVGQSGFLYTLISIVLTLLVGWGLGVLLKVKSKTSILVSTGTAICGGSAIAAVSPVLKAKEVEISLALSIVFTLNALALFLFPLIGTFLELSQYQFAVWAAIAIHDTSSVVGAATSYGNEALNIATTIKLVRALWILPLVIVLALILKPKDSKMGFPLFIVFFLAASALNSFVPVVSEYSSLIYSLARVVLVMVLFLVGCSLNRGSLKSEGLSAISQGVVLWCLVSAVSLFWVYTWL